MEVYVKASLETCIKRDVKGFYQAALCGKIANFTGISHPYEKPLNPDIEVDTDKVDAEGCAQVILNRLIHN